MGGGDFQSPPPVCIIEMLLLPYNTHTSLLLLHMSELASCTSGSRQAVWPSI